MAAAAGKDILKGLISGCIGLFVSTIGLDNIVGVSRFTFDIPSLMSGFNLLPVLIGVFAMAQVLEDSEYRQSEVEIIKQDLTGIWPTWREMKSVTRALIVGCVIGIIIGVAPGPEAPSLLRGLQRGEALVQEQGPLRQGEPRRRGGAGMR